MENLIPVPNSKINIYPAAAEKIFEIYQDEQKLPKVPKHWIGRVIIKDELNSFLDIKPLPVIYDIAALAFSPREYVDPEIQEKINAVITYILDPRFQILPVGYGLLWVKSRRIEYSLAAPIHYDIGKFFRNREQLNPFMKKSIYDSFIQGYNSSDNHPAPEDWINLARLMDITGMLALIDRDREKILKGWIEGIKADITRTMRILRNEIP